MSKKSLLVGISVLMSLGLVSCGEDKTNTSLPATSNGTSEGTDVSSAPSSQGTESQESSSSSSVKEDPTDALETAFLKDYSNSTVFIGQLYDNGETEEDAYEYYAENYQIVYDVSSQVGAEEPSYLYYHDYEDKSYLYFEGSSTKGEKTGWLNKGSNDAYVGLGSAYLDLRALAASFTENVDKYAYISGVYMISDEDVVDAIVEDAFSFAWFNTIDTIAITLDSQTGGFKTIKAFDSTVSVDKNLVQVNVDAIGTTNAVGTLPPKPTDSNTYEYWEYKGWTGPLKYVYPTAVTLPSDTKTLEIEHSVKLTPSLVMEKADASKNHIVEDKTLTVHSTNEKVVTVSGGFEGGDITIVAVGKGEAEVYVTASSDEGDDKGVSSNRVKVNVNGLKEQNLTDAVYDFDFTGKTGEIIGATNKITTNQAPYSIKGNEGVIVSGSASDSGVFGDDTAIIFNAFNQETLNTEEAGNAVATFDFGDQEVSGISFYYGGYYSNFKQNANMIEKIAIETSQDGTTWTQAADIKEEIISNISHDNYHLLEKSFAPVSKVRIRVDGSSIGKSFDMAMPGIAFIASDECHDHGVEDKVLVESVDIAADKKSLYVGQSQRLSFVVLPNNATDKTLDWTSTDPEVLEVKDGTVKALKAGTAKVYATSHDKGNVKSQELTFTVKDMPVLTADYEGTFKGEDNNLKTIEVTVSTSEKKAEVVYNSLTYTLNLSDYDDENNSFVFAKDNNLIKLNYSESESKMSMRGVLDGKSLQYGNGNPLELRKYVALKGMTIKAKNDVSEINGGTSVIVNAVFNPTGATDVDLKWTSSNPTVLQVPDDYDSSLNVISLSSSKVSADTDVVITAKDLNSGLVSNELHLKVLADKKVTAISLKAPKTTLKAGEETQLTYEITPNDATNKELLFTSGDETVATVDKNGLVKAKAIAADTDVTITATAQDGSGIKGTIVLTVKKNDESSNPLANTSWTGTDSDYSCDFTVAFDSKLALTISGGYASDPETLALNKTEVNGTVTTYTYDDGMTFTGVIMVYDSATSSLILDVGEGTFYDGTVNYTTNIEFSKQ